MQIPLYTETTRESALEAFGSTNALSFFGGEFIVADRAVLGLFTTAPAGTARVETRSEVCWRLSREPDIGEKTLDWWPEPVVHGYDRSGPSPVRVRDHQLFLRTERDASSFVYLGRADLAVQSPGEAQFQLETPLPRALWRRFGGYDGWRVELEHESHNVGDGDRAALDAHLAEFSSLPEAHLVLTRYEDDSLHLFRNERCAWLMYLREPGDPGVYVQSSSPELSSEEETFACDCGIDLQFPSTQTLPVSGAADVARFFFMHGTLPKDREWTD